MTVGPESFPPQPEPHTIEVEPTNHCSAACSFCPHSRMKREKGFMDVERFRTLVQEVHARRDQWWLNRHSSGAVFPRFVFAGLGEPTLHPDLETMVEICTMRGFPTRVVTNGGHLRASLVERLLRTGLSSLAVSLHSLNPDIYHSTMKLRLDRTLPRITAALRMLKGTDVEVEIWRVKPPPGRQQESPTDQQRFESFMDEFPDVRVLGPSEPWSRDDTVPNSVHPLADDSEQSGLWCHAMFFTHNVAWDGTAVMCCVDFHRITEDLGNVFEDGFASVQDRRRRMFSRGPRALCQTCRKWPDQEYAELFRKHFDRGSPA